MTQSSDEPAKWSGEGLFGPGPRSQWLAKIQAETRLRCQIRRERVLAYPDLAGKLTQPPLEFSQPQMWNGYIPPKTGHVAEPETLHSPARFRETGFRNASGRKTQPTDLNESPRREALLAIWTEAARRDKDAGVVVEVRGDIFTMLPMPPDPGQPGPPPASAAQQAPPPPATEPLPGSSWPEGTIGAQANPPGRNRRRREPA